MKTALNYRHFIIPIAAGLLVLTGLFAGCSSDDVEELPTGPGNATITIDDVIFNPKSPAPGDTLQATAVVSVDVINPGEFATYKWTADGGTFIEDDKASVRWVAPINSSIYNISVTASLTSSSSNLDANVFVGQLTDFIDERGGELYPSPAGDEMYYLSGPSGIDGGLVVRMKDAVSDVEVFPGMIEGYDFSFDKNLTHGAHLHLTPFPWRITVMHDDLVAGTQSIIAIDEQTLTIRPYEFSAPYVSNDGQMIAYQGALLDQILPPSAGGVDTFTVYVHDIASGEATRGTFETRSFYPTISSDHNHVVFVSDKDGALLWELYALPLTGTTVTPDTIPGALIKLTDTGGFLGGESIPPSTVPMEWNPNSAMPLIAVIGTDEKMRIASTDGSPAILVNLPGKVTDMKWSADGQTIAASVFDSGINSIYLVSASGEPTRVLDALAGDKYGSLSWSPDGGFLVYLVTRSPNVWYELFDPTGAGQTVPVRITPAMIPGEAVDYGPPLQSFRPVWEPGTKNVFLFKLDGATPGVNSLDLSGVGQ